MGIYIKGVELPKCDDWLGLNIRIYEDGTIWKHIGFGDYNLAELKAIEVPEPHGRLIDADELEGEFLYCDEADRLARLQDAPTIIERSE